MQADFGEPSVKSSESGGRWYFRINFAKAKQRSNFDISHDFVNIQTVASSSSK